LKEIEKIRNNIEMGKNKDSVKGYQQLRDHNKSFFIGYVFFEFAENEASRSDAEEKNGYDAGNRQRAFIEKIVKYFCGHDFISQTDKTGQKSYCEKQVVRRIHFVFEIIIGHLSAAHISFNKIYQSSESIEGTGKQQSGTTDVAR